jgi:hypothetical protein
MNLQTYFTRGNDWEVSEQTILERTLIAVPIDHAEFNTEGALPLNLDSGKLC